MRRALVVGIDDYPHDPLTGCCNDAKRLGEVLGRNGDQSKNFECVTLTSPATKVTRSMLLEAITRALRDPADVAYFHFSGHGTTQSLSGYLVTPDAEEYDLGVPMSEVLALANSSVVKEIFITLDCCYSGAFGTIPETGWRGLCFRMRFRSSRRRATTKFRLSRVALASSLRCWSRRSRVEPQGFKEKSAQLANVYAYIDNALGAWDQRPLFKANVSKFTQLRRAQPKLDVETLRRLTKRFELPAEDLPLSPAYEPNCEPHDAEKEACFRDLQRYRNAGLLEPVGE